MPKFVIKVTWRKNNQNDQFKHENNEPSRLRSAGSRKLSSCCYSSWIAEKRIGDSSRKICDYNERTENLTNIAMKDKIFPHHHRELSRIRN